MSELVGAGGWAWDKVTESSYIIWSDGGTPPVYYAKNGQTGQIQFSGTDAADVVQDIVDVYIAASSGGAIYFKTGLFNFGHAVSFNGIPAGVGILFIGAGYDETVIMANAANINLFESTNALWFSTWRDLQLRGRGQGDASGSGIYFNGATLSDCSIINCFIQHFKDYGVYALGWNTNIRGNIIEYCGNAGIKLQNQAADVKIIQNKFLYCYGNGLEFVGGTSSYSNEVIGNFLQKQEKHGLFLGSTGTVFRTTIMGNTFSYNSFDAAGSYYNLYGLRMDDCIVSGNSFSGSSVTKSGIYANGDNNVISGNLVYGHYEHGIVCYELFKSIISDNNVYENSQKTHNTYDGIYITLSDDNLVSNNVVYHGGGANQHKYGIHITSVTSEDNEVINNYLTDSGATARINDLGARTRLSSKTFQFTEPIVGAIVVVSPTGVDVDAATEGALAWGQIPVEVQQVVRLKIWAVATDGPINAGGQMHLATTLNAGASNAAYNTAAKSWAIIDFDSEEADYVADDVVHWIIENADVGTELLNLAAGDSFEFFALYNAGADPDGATDAVFRCIEIEYV